MSKRTKKATELEVLREKVAIYEGLLHDINMYAAICLRGDLVQELVDNICNWSYAHRVGNGENSEERQDEIVRRAFLRLRDVKQDQKKSPIVYNEPALNRLMASSSGISGFSGAVPYYHDDNCPFCKP